VNEDAGSPLPAANAPRARPGWPALILALAVVIYGGGCLAWYLQTPLGRAPQLDGQENLVLAGQISAGTLPHEPFYRAMLYPAVLAAPLKLGVSADNLPVLASTFGLLCHFAITLAVAILAARLWRGPRARTAAWLAAALWGLNPVALYYAVQVLDVVPALALFIWGLVWWTGKDRLTPFFGGIFLGLAVAARPHFLSVVFVMPVAGAWLAGRWRPRIDDAFTWAGAPLVLAILGIVQWQWSGEFRVLPWQGSYNFYAANQPGANGKYYVQQLFIADLPPGENPARAESELLYAKATGLPPPFSPAAMEAYWWRQGWAAIEAQPGAWLKLMARKVYYLCNDYDQYNNFTYAWQQARSLWLAWNFLGWGVLFVLTAAVIPMAWVRAREEDKKGARLEAAVMPVAWSQARGETGRSARLAGFGLIFLAYAGGVLLYYASGRFRLPLMPLLCVIAGGLATASGWRYGRGAAIVVTLFAAGLTFSNLFNARDESTFIQDEMLAANAASTTGDDAQAYALAEEGLQRDGTRPDLRRLAVISFFNLTLADGAQYDTVAGWKKTAKELLGLELQDATLVLVEGAAAWKTGDAADAEKIWQAGADRFGESSAPASFMAAARFLRGAGASGAPPPDAQILDYLKKIPH
jgi:hypothetical protein